jgi:hypothetical protein
MAPSNRLSELKLQREQLRRELIKLPKESLQKIVEDEPNGIKKRLATIVLQNRIDAELKVDAKAIVTSGSQESDRTTPESVKQVEPTRSSLVSKLLHKKISIRFKRVLHTKLNSLKDFELQELTLSQNDDVRSYASSLLKARNPDLVAMARERTFKQFSIPELIRHVEQNQADREFAMPILQTRFENMHHGKTYQEIQNQLAKTSGGIESDLLRILLSKFSHSPCNNNDLDWWREQR